MNVNLLSIWRKLGPIAALAVGLSSALPAAAQDKPVIRVAVEGAYPPFNYLDQNNELQGFEVDLLQALCDAMNAECVPTVHQWDGIMRGLLNKEYDAIMSSLEITERRQKRIAFTNPYYRIPAIFIGLKEMPPCNVTPRALAEKRIGTADRSDHETYLKEFYKDSEIELYGKTEEANLDLLVGRLDAVFGDKRFLTKFLESREGSCCHILGDSPANPAYRHQSYGIGLRKEDVALKDRFNAAIARVMADGTYDRIRAKYFSFDIK